MIAVSVPMCRSSSSRSVRSPRAVGWRRLPALAFVVGFGAGQGAPARIAAQATGTDNRGTARVAARAVPSPESYLGFQVGADRKLADWNEVTGYLSALAQSSDRVRFDTLGSTTLGRPFILLTISDPDNLARLEQLWEVQSKLADPRRIRDAEERERLIRQGRTVVLITSSIHSTEVGGTQVPMRIAYRLASESTPDIRSILDNTIVLLIPSLNPDGVQLVVDWYESTLGKPWEGASPPFLYHHYVGHDNNRDWYAFTQVETRLAIRAHNTWHPEIVHDIHQQGQWGSRLFVPPWIDPYEPNVDPSLTAAINALGTDVAWALQRQGKMGVVVDATYDAWTPARAYQHYHGGVRILTETASANLASPIVVPFDSLRQGRGFHARKRSWNFPQPWPGGEWHLSDIVDYMEAGAFALLNHAARNREAWLRNFVAIGERAVAGWDRWPEAWVIPAGQEERDGLPELIRILRTGAVEIGKSEAAFRAGGREFGAGSYVVRMHQPYASFAQALLEVQHYPDLREYPGGPLRRPYDVTAQTLPLLLGVEAVPLREPLTVATRPVREPPPLHRVAPGLSGSNTVRVGLYQPWAPSMDEGWTRWIFDQYRVPYETVHNADIREGGLIGRFTAIVLASSSPTVLRDGRKAGTIPERYAGGLGEDGAVALREFVQAGGTLVALDQASLYAIEALDLPLRNLLADVERDEFYAPGSLVRLELDPSSRIAATMPAATAAWLQGGIAFQISAPAAKGQAETPSGPDTPSRGHRVSPNSVQVVGRYGRDPVLLSGWLQGSGRIAGKPALVEVRVGKGRVVLFGFRPQYRAQSVATYPLLFEALKE